MRSPLNALLSMRKARLACKAGTAGCDYLPHRLIVESSSVCDLRCPMCPVSLPVKFGPGTMKFETFRRIVAQSASFVSEIDLSHRGEPLFNEHLPRMIAYADEKRVFTTLSTNATRLTEEVALRLIQSGLRSITFSVDGLEREAYERIRVGARFDEVMENIANFLRMRKRLRSRTPLTTIEVLDLDDSPVDKKKVSRLLRNFGSLSPDRIVIRSPHTWAGTIQLNRADGGVSCRAACYRACPIIWSTMVILWDGSVALCPRDWYNDNPLGNIHDSSLEKMWNGWTITFVRGLLADGEYRQIEVCSQCDVPWGRAGSSTRNASGEMLIAGSPFLFRLMKRHGRAIKEPGGKW